KLGLSKIAVALKRREPLLVDGQLRLPPCDGLFELLDLRGRLGAAGLVIARVDLEEDFAFANDLADVEPRMHRNHFARDFRGDVDNIERAHLAKPFERYLNGLGLRADGIHAERAFDAG